MVPGAAPALVALLSAAKANNMSFGYQWQRDNQGGGVYSNIASATSATYVLTDADDGCKIRCVVTASNGLGSNPANSNATALVTEPIATNTVAPTVSGPAPAGSILSAATGTWTSMAGLNPTYTYQWTKGGVDIGGATSSTYITQAGDVGGLVGCKVTAHNTGGVSGAVASSNTITVGAAAGNTNRQLRVAVGFDI